MAKLLLSDGTDLEEALAALARRITALEEQRQEPEPQPEPAPQPAGIWLSRDELDDTSHAAWDAVYGAVGEYGNPSLSERSTHSAYTFALALLAAGTQREEFVDLAQEAIVEVIAAPYALNDVLAVCRRLAAYPIAADLIDLPALDPELDGDFRAWLREALSTEFSGGGGGGTIAGVHERRPNNFGTHAGASRIACALYLGDDDELARAAAVFRGWLGERDAYAGFSYGSDLSWQCNPDAPVGINPAGCTKEGRNIDGVLPDDQRRSGPFSPAIDESGRWQPPRQNYVWEALQGAMAQAWLLSRAGYADVWEWSDRALLRAVMWLYHVCDFPAVGDDSGLPYLIDHIYGMSYATDAARPGKNGLGVSYALLNR